MKFGAHMSTSGGVWKALERGASIGCQGVQLFVKNNMQWFGKPFAPPVLAEYQQQVALQKIPCVFGHTGYLINLASPPGPNRANSIESLVQEIELATSLNIPFLVMHPGAHMGAGEKTGLKRCIAGLNEAFARTPDSPVRIALENTAGQGTCLGYAIGHLATIYAGVKSRARLGVCLDTAHFFAAGYDLRTEKGWRSAIDEVADSVGLEEVLAFHLNDSKTELGSRVDRHEHIGKGRIGRKGFKAIVNDARFRHLPGCLETPKSEDLREDLENLAVLRALVDA